MRLKKYKELRGKLHSKLEYWSIITDEKLAVVISSEGKDRYTVSGEIDESKTNPLRTG